MVEHVWVEAKRERAFSIGVAVVGLLGPIIWEPQKEHVACLKEAFRF